MTITNRPRVGGPATNDEVQHVRYVLFNHAAAWPRSAPTASRRRSPSSSPRSSAATRCCSSAAAARARPSCSIRISEALGLEHRHYNASLISFDDLVGFPYPDEAKASVRFLETPATVWGAESVLIDEISRCKPEHQNRLFSLVHERKIQGLAAHQAALPLGGDEPVLEPTSRRTRTISAPNRSTRRSPIASR